MHYSLRRPAFGGPVLDRNASNTLQMMEQNIFLRHFSSKESSEQQALGG